MKCEKCGKGNPDNNLYCSNCGAPVRTKIVCSRCNKELPTDSKFCIYCGAKAKVPGGANAVRPKPPVKTLKAGRRARAASSTKKRGPARKIRWSQIVVAVIVGVTVAAIVGVVISPSSRGSASAQNPGSGTPPNITWAQNVQQIAAQFNCPCEKCGVIRLDLCTCDIARGAVETKSYIQDLLNQELPTSEIIQKIDQRYGHRI